MKILVAGFGNVLQQDDAFGVRLVKILETRTDLEGVTFLDAGIGGISLVQELLGGGYDAAVLLDAVEGERPGEVKTLALDVADPADLGINAARDYLADIHYAEPGRALALAKGVGSLPQKTYLVGCVPTSCELGEGLSPPVESALADAADRVVQLIESLRAATMEPPEERAG